MKALEKLREWTMQLDGDLWFELSDLCDAIGRELDEYVKLPVDADGVPWTAEDGKFDNGIDGPIELNMIAYSAKTGEWYLLDDTKATHVARLCHHVKSRTIEDVLEDYVVEYQTRHVRSKFGAEHFDHVDVHEMVKRCADEIRELQGGDAR